MGFIVAAPEQVPGTARIRTYFGRIGVRLPGGNTVRITTDAVTVNNNMVMSWTNSVAVYKGRACIAPFQNFGLCSVCGLRGSVCPVRSPVGMRMFPL